MATFLRAVERLFRKEKWSLDAIRGRLLSNGVFQKQEVVCTKTLYHYVEDGLLSIKPIDLPEKLSRKKAMKKEYKAKRILGQIIETRPREILKRESFGHRELDTMIGAKEKEDAVLLVLTERKTRMNLCAKLASKSAEQVGQALQKIVPSFGSRYQEVFRTITCNNGLEFTGLQSSLQVTPVYYYHPYSSYERRSNERQNRIMRRFIRKGEKIQPFSEEDILWFTDKINALPRNLFQYKTSEELFEVELDRMYTLSA